MTETQGQGPQIAFIDSEMMLNAQIYKKIRHCENEKCKQARRKSVKEKETTRLQANKERQKKKKLTAQVQNSNPGFSLKRLSGTPSRVLKSERTKPLY